MAFGKFTGFDFYQMDSLLSEEEKMARQTVREFVDEDVLPIIDRHYRGRHVPELTPSEMAELGLFGANPPGEVRLRRDEQRGLRAGHAGAGARRQRRAQLRVGAERLW